MLSAPELRGGMPAGRGQGSACKTYLWKTETQLSSPLAHFAWYSSNFGFTDSRKGPMNGIFQEGPTMEPLFLM